MLFDDQSYWEILEVWKGLLKNGGQSLVLGLMRLWLLSLADQEYGQVVEGEPDQAGRLAWGSSYTMTGNILDGPDMENGWVLAGTRKSLLWGWK